MKKLHFTTKTAIALYAMLSVVLSSCTTSAKKEGEIVKDKNGKYYQLTNENVLGNERYRLIEIDTASFKLF